MPTLSELGEFETIRRLIQARPRAGSAVALGGGDDAAVMRPEPGLEVVATTDAFVEGKHWLPERIASGALGARLAAANLSDLGAMAAQPRWGLISMGIRPDHDFDDLLAIDQGVAHLLAAHGAALVGGNLTSVTGPEWMSLTLLGTCGRGRAWRRSGARAGDRIAITGSPGRAAAALGLFEKYGKPANDAWWTPLAEDWAAPVPRVGFASRAAETGLVTAAIDISDGFASDLAHLCQASRVGVELDAARWPTDPLLKRAAQELGVEIDDLRLSPGDDYELILAVNPEREAALAEAARFHATPLAFIGHFTANPNRVWRRYDEERVLGRTGWDHFAVPGGTPLVDSATRLEG